MAELEAHRGAFQGRRVTALLAAEAGGGNCLEPLVVGARLGLPVVDGDLMGRAFPELQVRKTGGALTSRVWPWPSILYPLLANALYLTGPSSVVVSRLPSQMMTSAIYGVPITPCALAGEGGDVVVMRSAADMHSVERVMRAVCDALGASVGLSTSPMDAAMLRKVRRQCSDGVLPCTALHCPVYCIILSNVLPYIVQCTALYRQM